MNANLTSIAVAASLFPGFSHACWEQAAQKHTIPVPLLVAVARAESALNPRAVNRSHSDKTGTVDIGIMQINSDRGTLKNLGVTAEQLLDPCTNIDAGARILAEKMARHGRTWEAVGAYNASCISLTTQQCLRVRMRYAWRVYRFLIAWPATKPPVIREFLPSPIVRVRLG
ncbi:lytic transglycosylase domain-containing protein [Pseudoduganella sp. UC29_106]|uniref:lytic transglycosylase domain-containing protein n=1 Tax=Pseudoduganella sp. UC29_106 TaxID=3374553 RepID=UPI0037570671